MYSLSDVNELLARSDYLRKVIQLRHANKQLMDDASTSPLEKTLTHINESCKVTRMTKSVLHVSCEPYFI